MTTLLDRLPPPGADPVDVLEAFAAWAADGGRPLYPHQDEAGLALAAGDHVVLATPTGSSSGTSGARNMVRSATSTATSSFLTATTRRK